MQENLSRIFSKRKKIYNCKTGHAYFHIYNLKFKNMHMFGNWISNINMEDRNIHFAIILELRRNKNARNYRRNG